MNFAPLIIALVVVLVYIAALKLYTPPTPQTATMLNLVVGLILLALIVAAFWPLVAQLGNK